MKKIIFILVIISFWEVSFSQNAHFEFWLSNSPTPNSAITIIHKENARAYLIQTESNNIHVSQIDPTDMQPVDSTTSYINIGNLYSRLIHLNGGYKDFQGNLIAYGYAIINNLRHYLIIKIDLSSMNLDFIISLSGEIIEGCCGKDVHGNTCNLFLLSNANNSINEVIAYDEDLTICTTKSLRSGSGTITDISWDSYHEIFLASGSYSYFSSPNLIFTDPFLIYFKCDTVDTNFFSVGSQYIISNQQFFTRAEGRTLHEVIDDQHLVLTQDLRDTASDYIWIIRVDNFSTQPVFNSTNFKLPRPKLILQDMKYDSYHKKLTILGRNVLCEEGVNFIAQINPLLLTDLKIAVIMDKNYNSSCIIFNPPIDTTYGNHIYLQRLELNPFNKCHTILSTGINMKRVYITETYDIARPKCDSLIHTFEYYPTLIDTCYLNANTPNFFYAIRNAQTPSVNLYLNQDTICDDLANCGKGSINPNINNQLTKPTPKINLYSCEYFECNHFSETVYYYLYDLAGKVLFHGITENGVITSLPNFTNGIYILSVVDKVGNKKSEKVIYFK